ncbi:MAG: PHP-associated domain-containing protein [Candidatus Nanoarchaeia archaeon]|nr:PHP-associated domain-containing protein [Candidatus Nanoarchaeia archaeon]
MTKVKADLHNHLRTSGRIYDTDFNTAIDIAAKRLGEGAVFGVVNFDDKRYERFTEFRGYERVYVGENCNGFYVPEKKVLVVKGQEVPTKEGHLLVIGLGKNAHLTQHRTLAETLKEAEDNQGVTIVDHPFHSHGLGSYLESNPEPLMRIDAIEVYNGEAAFGIPGTPFPYGANKRAQTFYDRIKSYSPHLGALASSDGHSMYELGRSWTEIDEPDLVEKTKFADSLKESVRNTDSQTPKRKKNSVFGAIDHLVDLAFIVKVAPRIGLGKLFETDRP